MKKIIFVDNYNNREETSIIFNLGKHLHTNIQIEYIIIEIMKGVDNMCNNDTDNNTCCIAEILSVINVLQQNADCCGDTCLDTCDRGFLGNGTTTLGYNTRPVILYTAFGNGTPCLCT